MSAAKFAGALFCLLFLGACNVTKHLDSAQGERLLVKASVQFKSEKRMGLSDKVELAYQTSGQFKQKPNKRLFYVFYPRLSAYYWAEHRDRKFARWVKRVYAEPPAIYDDKAAQKTAENFENFMQMRGYFNAKCSYKTQFIGKNRAKTDFTVALGPQFTISTIEYAGVDSNILRVAKSVSNNSLLKPGGAVDGQAFEAEKLRLTNEIRNRGYAYFVSNYIEFEGDSSGHKTAVIVNILPQNDSTLHQVYTIDNVAVFTSLVPDLNAIRSDRTLDSVYYVSSEPQFWIKPKYLHKAISLRPGQPYSQAEFEKTNKKLSSLGAFRFVAVRPVQDSIATDKLDVAISFAPHKRIGVGGSVDLNYSNSSVTGLFGVSANAFVRNRNLLRGAENLITNLQYNIEFQPKSLRENPIFSQEIKVQNELSVPRFYDYLGGWSLVNQLDIKGYRLVPNHLLQLLRSDARSHIRLNYNFVLLTNRYSYNLFNAAFGYDIPFGSSRVYNFDHVGIDLLRTQLRPEFEQEIQKNPLLGFNFSDQLFTGFLLRNFNYAYKGAPNSNGEKWNFNFSSDLSGLEMLFLNSAWNYFTYNDENWKLGRLEYAKYWRVEITGSYTRDITQSLWAGCRVTTGAVAPLARNLTTPYVKKLFVGGPSSIRAWQIRQTGPGGFYDPEIADVTPYYQASDFKLDLSGEVRFPVFWWLKGAVFADAGNIWAISNRSSVPPETLLSWDSYKDIAIGVGAGLRFDFDYSVIRLDMGVKVRSPYAVPEQGYRYWYDWRRTPFGELSNFNLAVGYPF